MLVRIRPQAPGLISDEASARIRDTIIRLGICLCDFSDMQNIKKSN